MPQTFDSILRGGTLLDQDGAGDEIRTALDFEFLSRSASPSKQRMTLHAIVKFVNTEALGKGAK